MYSVVIGILQYNLTMIYNIMTITQVLSICVYDNIIVGLDLVITA